MTSNSLRWWRLSLPLQPELEESLLWKLDSLGLHRLAVQHAPERPDQRTLLAWLPAPEWDEDQRRELVDSLRPLAETFALSFPQPEWVQLDDEDWSLTWKQHWQADPVGQRLLILPAWLEAPQEHAHRLVLRMDPGSAFGTGSHPTTRLCLEALEARPVPYKMAEMTGRYGWISPVAAAVVRETAEPGVLTLSRGALEEAAARTSSEWQRARGAAHV